MPNGAVPEDLEGHDPDLATGAPPQARTPVDPWPQSPLSQQPADGGAGTGAGAAAGGAVAAGGSGRALAGGLAGGGDPGRGSGGPARARRRLPWWLAAIAAATALLAVAVFVLVLRWPGDGAALSSEPLSFQPLEQVAEVTFRDRTNTTFSQVVGDRAYAASVQGESLEVIAIDLGTGEELWRQLVTGVDRWQRIVGLPDAVVVFGDDFSSAEPRPMIVLDAADGGERWRRDIHGDDQVWMTGDTVLLVDRNGGRLRGLDPADGEPRWSEVFPGGGRVTVAPVLSAADLNRPSTLFGNVPPPFPSGRVVMVGQDRSAVVTGTTSGEQITAGTNIAEPRDLILAYGQWLLVATDEAGYRVDAYSLTDLDAPPRAVYRVPDAARSPVSLRPCGDGRVCVLDRAGGDRATTEVVALDVEGEAGTELWRREAPEATRVLVSGSWTVVGGGSPEVRVFDRDGEPVLDGTGAAVRLNAGNLLAFSSMPSSVAADLSVAGRPVDEPHTELGLAREVMGESCSWSEEHLVCPTRDGAQVWRFTE